MVMADALPHGAAPSGNLSTRSIWNHRFVCPTVLPQMLCPWNLLGWLTVQVPFSLKFSSLKSQVAGSTGHPDQCALCGVLCSTAALRREVPPHRLLAIPAKTSAWRPASLLYLGISPFCGQQRSVWKCGPDSPSMRSSRASILGCSHHTILSRSPILVVFK